MLKTIIFQYIVQYGYIGLFGSMMLGMIGLPVPDELLMTFTGYLVFKGKLLYGVTLIVASFGAISGVSFSFFLGRKWGLPLLEKHGKKIHLTPDRLKKSEAWFERFGKFTVTISYFIPGIRHLTALSAGISKWNYRTFLLYAVPGGIAWALTFVTLGYYLGENWRAFTESLHRYMLYSALGLTIGISIFLLLYRHKSHKLFHPESPAIHTRVYPFWAGGQQESDLQKHPGFDVPLGFDPLDQDGSERSEQRPE